MTKTAYRLCIWCGEPITLPEIQGVQRIYCSITCSTAAQQHRREHKHVCDCGCEMICPSCDT